MLTSVIFSPSYAIMQRAEAKAVFVMLQDFFKAISIYERYILFILDLQKLSLRVCNYLALITLVLYVPCTLHFS